MGDQYCDTQLVLHTSTFTQPGPIKMRFLILLALCSVAFGQMMKPKPIEIKCTKLPMVRTPIDYPKDQKTPILDIEKLKKIVAEKNEEIQKSYKPAKVLDLDSLATKFASKMKMTMEKLKAKKSAKIFKKN